MELNSQRGYEAQMSIIGTLLIEPSLSGEIFHRLRSEDFLDPSLRNLFDGAQSLFSRGTPIDPVILLDVVGQSYKGLIRECMQMVPTTVNWKLYIKSIREASALSKLQDIASQVLEANNAKDARDLMSGAEKLLMDRPAVRIVSFAQGLHEFANRMYGETRRSYIDWGIRQLNQKIYAEAGDFIVLGAYPSVGKTVLGMQFAFTMATRCKVGVFSLETKDQKLYDRLISRVAKIDFARVKMQEYSEKDKKAVSELMRYADRVNLDVINATGMSVNDIRAITLANKYDFIMVDYLQLLDGPGGSRPEIVTNISMALHTMAQSLGVVVLALSQLTPPDSGSRHSRQSPGMFSLRESRQLAQDADVIMLLELANAGVEDQGEDQVNYANCDRWLQIVKNKEGEQGKIRLEFDSKHLEFVAPVYRPHQPHMRPRIYKQEQVEFRELSEEVESPFDENRGQN